MDEINAEVSLVMQNHSTKTFTKDELQDLQS